jgi:hypothetical protein
MQLPAVVIEGSESNNRPIQLAAYWNKKRRRENEFAPPGKLSSFNSSILIPASPDPQASQRPGTQHQET